MSHGRMASPKRPGANSSVNGPMSADVKSDTASPEGIFVMARPRLTLAGTLSFLLPLTIGLTFPIQVVSGVTAAGALSLVLLATMTVVALLTRRITKPLQSTRMRSVLWDWLAVTWVVVSILNLPVSWMAFGAQAVAGSVPVLYLAVEAGLIYYYFSRIASDRELHYFFAGMVTMGYCFGSLLCL